MTREELVKIIVLVRKVQDEFMDKVLDEDIVGYDDTDVAEEVLKRLGEPSLPEEKPVNIITELENLLEANGMYIDNDWKVRCNNGDSTDNRWQYEFVARHFYSIRQGGHKNEKEKPVDLEKEIEEIWNHNKVLNPNSYDGGYELQLDKINLTNLARYFFNLGRMAKKD